MNYNEHHSLQVFLKPHLIFPSPSSITHSKFPHPWLVPLLCRCTSWWVTQILMPKILLSLWTPYPSQGRVATLIHLSSKFDRGASGDSHQLPGTEHFISPVLVWQHPYIFLMTRDWWSLSNWWLLSSPAVAWAWGHHSHQAGYETQSLIGHFLNPLLCGWGSLTQSSLNYRNGNKIPKYVTESDGKWSHFYFLHLCSQTHTC